MAAVIPIWQDTNYITSQSPFSYNLQVLNGTITVNGNTVPNYETIFTGKAWAAPTESTTQINLNRIAQDALSIYLPDLREITGYTTVRHEQIFRWFRITPTTASTALQSFIFYGDWTYEDRDDYGEESVCLRSNPINGHRINGMMMFSTKGVLTHTLLDTNPSYYETAIGFDYRYITGYPNIVPLYPTEVCVSNGGYALYYLNRKCGYDAFLIEGNVTKKDTYEKYYINKSAANTTIDFSKKAYHNEITTSWELHTGWLSDAQSENLAFNLLPSNQIYLHDIGKNIFYPVVITDTEVTYKTRRNQNRRMYNYTINVEASQKMQNLG